MFEAIKILSIGNLNRGVIKLKIIVTVLILLLLINTPAVAQGTVDVQKVVDVYVNSVKFESDEPAFLDSKLGRTFVPLRFITQALGGNVSWNYDTKTATVNKAGLNITMPIGSNKVLVNGNLITLDAPARLINGRTMVPLRFVSEALNAKVVWNGNLGAVYLTSEK